jgi:hypothetical protein
MLAIPLRGRLDWAHVAVAAWGAVILGVGAHAYLHPQSHTVFDVYRDAARKWWTGQDMYEPGRELYRYSPFFAVAISPFAMLPDTWGNAFWKVFNVLVFAAGLASWSVRVLPARLNVSQMAILFLLALPLSMHSLYNGQANLLMVGAALLSLSAVLNEQWNLAAGWLALVTMIKAYPVGFALLLVALYPRRLAMRFVAALALMLAAPYATQSFGVVTAQYASWYSRMHESTHIMRERVRSVDNLFELAGHPLAPGVYPLLELLAGGVVLFVCLTVRRHAVSRQVLLLRTYQWFAVWIALFGPETEACTFVVLAPAIAWEMYLAFTGPARVWRRLLLCASLLLMGPLTGDFFPAAIRNFCNNHSGQTFGALLFTAYLLCVTWRNSAGDEKAAAKEAERHLCGQRSGQAHAA